MPKANPLYQHTNRIELVRDARQGWPSRRGGDRKIAARAALARALWAADGSRRVPLEHTLDAVLGGLRRGELDWICEFSPLGPLYLLPTSRWIRVLATSIRELGAKRVLEVAAGDGFLSRALREVAPDLHIIASDSGRWENPTARMTAEERRALAGRDVPGLALGDQVVRLEAREAIRKYRPDLVLASWLPPGRLLDQLIRSKVRHVLEIGAAGGVTASQWSWRFNHEFCEGPIEKLARCRLDARPGKELHTRVTLYFGAAHKEYFCERVRPEDWLWQFRPTSPSVERAGNG